ncbi:uncharacterized protein ARMOST_06239 [Armillaria ostoyae]|uniref:CxC2-like cysteine cluster KDZ transposase-associated domain-containing protein n=1 Tax=Armillaria ostoyae TaxID=47428 RepID=A0A284R2H1_ARMOS|nr:uncharacterized protein ARMOST_06239 [Armillaria ostoyae]
MHRGIKHCAGPTIIPNLPSPPHPPSSAADDGDDDDTVVPTDLSAPELVRPRGSQRGRKRPTKGKAKKSIALKYPMWEWAGYSHHGGYKQQYLMELIWRKGHLANLPTTCITCGVNTKPNFHCAECSPGRLECQICCVKRHRLMPLHCIEEWTGTFFEMTSLKDMGLHMQLSHDNGSPCFKPHWGPNDMTVIHVNGIHIVAVDYCNCFLKTCASFGALELFHSLTLMGKLMGYDLYRAQTYLTDPTGMCMPKSQYKSFLRMARQWRHLHLLLHGRKGCEPDGANNVGPEELAIVCPACPIPGVNLPDGWEDTPPLIRWLYTLFVAMDANFRLKNLLHSDEISDPGLHTGNVYYVDDEKYKVHISQYPAQTDISSCSGFQTLAHAETKNNVGMHTTRVVACVCAHYEMVPRLGLDDLQKGEKYCNVDYVLLSGIQGVPVNQIFFSYDIVCQWSVNLVECMKEMPEEL